MISRCCMRSWSYAAHHLFAVVLIASAAGVAKADLSNGGAGQACVGDCNGSGPSQFIGARAVAVDGSAHVFAIDDGNDRVEVFTDGGAFLTTWGSGGTDDGQFDSAIGITVDPSGAVLVTDEHNRVQRVACSPTAAGATALSPRLVPPIVQGDSR